jgi:hypothetical protein
MVLLVPTMNHTPPRPGVPNAKSPRSRISGAWAHDNWDRCPPVLASPFPSGR